MACQHKVISSSSGKTGLTGSVNRSDRSIKKVIVGCHQEEKHDIIHIKVPRLSNIFNKVRFASNLPNFKSDRIVSVDTSTCDLIVSNPRRSIEEGKLIASNKIIPHSIGQCFVKLERLIIVMFWHLYSLHHHCQKFSLHGLLVVILELKARNQNRKAL